MWPGGVVAFRLFPFSTSAVCRAGENGKGLNATTPPGHIPKTGGLLPYVQQWSFGIQRQLTTNMSVDVNYVGAKGTHLHNEAIDFINQLDPRFISLGSLRSKPIGDPTVQAR